MTVQELSQLRSINREIEQKRKRLNEIKKFQARGSANFCGVGAVSIQGMSDKVLTEISYLHEQIDEELERCFKTLRKIEDFIASIEDSQMRMIISLRYVNGLSWQQVAFSIGEYDEQYPRRAHNAFFKQNSKKNNTN